MVHDTYTHTYILQGSGQEFLKHTYVGVISKFFMTADLANTKFSEFTKHTTVVVAKAKKLRGDTWV